MVCYALAKVLVLLLCNAWWWPMGAGDCPVVATGGAGVHPAAEVAEARGA